MIDWCRRGIALFVRRMKEEIDSQVMEDIMVKHGKVSHKKESSHQGYKPDPNISGTVKPASKKGRSQRHLHSK